MLLQLACFLLLGLAGGQTTTLDLVGGRVLRVDPSDVGFDRRDGNSTVIKGTAVSTRLHMLSRMLCLLLCSRLHACMHMQAVGDVVEHMLVPP